MKDLKLARKRGLDESKLNEVICIIAKGKTLSPKYRDHVLIANYKGLRECHIAPDWLLVYERRDVLRIGFNFPFAFAYRRGCSVVSPVIACKLIIHGCVQDSRTEILEFAGKSLFL